MTNTQEINKQMVWLIGGLILGIFTGIYGNVVATLYFEVFIKDDPTYALEFWFTSFVLATLVSLLIVYLVIYAKRAYKKEGDCISENHKKAQELKEGELPEDQILSLIRLIDSDDPKLFRPIDFFKGGSKYSVVTITILLVIVEIILVTQSGTSFEKLSVAVALSAFIVSYFSFMVHFGEGNILQVNFDRLEKHFEEKQKPLLKALLKIAGKHPKFNLEQIYDMNPDMFTQEKLLEKLYA